MHYDRFITTQNIDISAFGNIGLELDENNSLTFNATRPDHRPGTTGQRACPSEDNVANGTPVESYLLQWTENQIESHQLSGSHYLPFINDALFEWRAIDGTGKRDAPDARSYTYAENSDGLMEMVYSGSQAAGDLRDVYQAPERSYSKLKDSINEYGLDFEIPFTVLGIDTVFSTGYSDYDRTRKINDRLFRFDITSSAPDYVPLGNTQPVVRRPKLG